MMARRIGMFTSWAAMLLWMGVIYWFSAQVGTDSAAISGGFIRHIAGFLTPSFDTLSAAEQAAIITAWQWAVRKLAHLSEFALLGLLAFVTMGFHIPRRWHRAAVAAGIGLVYAISDEIHQMFVPDRGPAVVDVFIDFTGVCLGIALCMLALRWRCRKKKK